VNTKFQKEKQNTLLDANKEVCLEINAGRTEYMFTTCHHNAVQNDNINTANKCFKNAAKFKYLGTTVENKITFIKAMEDLN
jgi:hypothetical protein